MRLLILFLFSFFLPSLGVAAESFDEALNDLNQKSFSKKATAISALAKIDDPRTVNVLKTMLAGKLYYRKSDKKIVAISDAEDGVEITDVINGESLGVVSKRKLRKISVNNSLRRLLRDEIARVNISSKDPAVRYNAVKDMIKGMDESGAALLRAVVETEESAKVADVMKTAIALVDVEKDDVQIKLQAIKQLAESVEPEVKGRLMLLVKQNEDGSFVEPSESVRKAAQTAINAIDQKLKLYDFSETVFFGLSLGSVLLLSAIGLAITFGVMGVINMAHGELMMLGAYTTYVVQLLMPNYIDYSLFVAIPAAFLVAGFVGILIERGVIQFLYGRPLETLLATFGISLILQQMVRTIFSPLNRSVETPSWMSGAWEINSALSLTFNRLYIIIFSLLVFVMLLLILKKTALGLQVRAVSQNRDMAKAMGVKTNWVDAMTFGLGSGIAGVAGVALSQLTNVGPNLGQAYIIDSFMVVVFGGVGNLWGTLVAAMSLGVVNKFLEPWSGAVLAKILVLVFIILFIQKRPKGLFPQKGRAAED